MGHRVDIRPQRGRGRRGPGEGTDGRTSGRGPYRRQRARQAAEGFRGDRGPYRRQMAVERIEGRRGDRGPHRSQRTDRTGGDKDRRGDRGL